MLENILTFTCTIIINVFYAYLLLFTESCNFFSNSAQFTQPSQWAFMSDLVNNL